jgi:hypothetical protein
MHVDRSGYTGSWTADPTTISNAYFKSLLSEKWQPFTAPDAPGAQPQYKSPDKELYMLGTDLLFKYEPELATVASEFAADNAAFLSAFSAAWTKVMNADRYGGPGGVSACAADAPPAPPPPADEDKPPYEYIALGVGAGVGLPAAALVVASALGIKRKARHAGGSDADDRAPSTMADPLLAERGHGEAQREASFAKGAEAL